MSNLNLSYNSHDTIQRKVYEQEATNIFTATEITNTEKETTSAAKTSTNTETTEANTTETTIDPVTETQTQQTSAIETTVTVTLTTQSNIRTTAQANDNNSHPVTTTSGGQDVTEDYPKVIINGVTYYCRAVDDGFDEFTTDKFLGYGTDFEGVYHDNPTRTIILIPSKCKDRYCELEVICSLPVFGRNGLALKVYMNGVVWTNMVECGTHFYIGEEKALELIEKYSPKS